LRHIRPESGPTGVGRDACGSSLAGSLTVVRFGIGRYTCPYRRCTNRGHVRLLAGLGIGILQLVFGPLDRIFGWLEKRPLELIAGAYLLLVGVLGVLLIAFYWGQTDAATGWLLGGLLVAASVGGIYLLTPLGIARSGHEFVRMWFRGMAGVAAAVALAYLSAAASMTDVAKANSDMRMVALAAALALLSALVSLRSAK